MPKRYAILLIILITLTVVLIVYTMQTSIYNELNKLKLIPQPERFTELYFNDYAALPKETVAKEPISFSFTIHNLEGATTTYPYSTYFLYPDGEKKIFADGVVTLGDNASTSITINHTFLASDLTGAVVVNLTQMDQKIDFILPNTNP